jgi:4-alpha-glucanotransferase
MGDFGPEAYKFVDFLSEAKQSFWQILPLSPTSSATGNSPYSSDSAFARNIYFISPEFLVRDGYISESLLDDHPPFPDDRVDYDGSKNFRRGLLNIAYENKKDSLANDVAYIAFCNENNYWLDDYALFIALREQFDYAMWNDWRPDIRDRYQSALHEWGTKLSDRIAREKFFQYLFFRHWFALKEYCNNKGIQIIGDIPLYVDYNSATVWKTPEIFKLDDIKKPIFVAGVPPDYFSETGQLWGNPVFDWDKLRSSGYDWWIKRIRHNFKLYDLLRLDHFRGLVAYWEVYAGEQTAINGKWVATPVQDFFNTLLKHFPTLPIIAEDLGIITPDVREVMQIYGLPGMRILMFAFAADMPTNDYTPHNHVKNCVVYPGTHDNNTIRGWFENEALPEEKERLSRYLGRELDAENISWDVVRMAMMSVANTAVITMQDLLGLGQDARMNKPGLGQGNWEWRLPPGQADSSLARRIAEMVEIYGRV